MQTCSICNTQTTDNVEICPKCGANLIERSTIAESLRRMRENPRVKSIRIAVSVDACPACQQAQGVYSKENIPSLPVEGCSHKNGCRCSYQPDLDEIYP